MPLRDLYIRSEIGSGCHHRGRIYSFKRGRSVHLVRKRIRVSGVSLVGESCAARARRVPIMRPCAVPALPTGAKDLRLVKSELQMPQKEEPARQNEAPARKKEVQTRQNELQMRRKEAPSGQREAPARNQEAPVRQKGVQTRHYALPFWHSARRTRRLSC